MMTILMPLKTSASTKATKDPPAAHKTKSTSSLMMNPDPLSAPTRADLQTHAEVPHTHLHGAIEQD